MKKTLLFVILFTGVFSAGTLHPQKALAVDYSLQAPLEGESQTVGSFGEYVNVVYKFAIPAMGMLATIMTIFAGYKYMTAYGNPQQIQEAKEIFTGAITGIVLVITAVILLNLIGGDELTTIDL